MKQWNKMITEERIKLALLISLIYREKDKCVKSKLLELNQDFQI